MTRPSEQRKSGVTNVASVLLREHPRWLHNLRKNANDLSAERTLTVHALASAMAARSVGRENARSDLEASATSFLSRAL